jgi:hypothetical protein
VSPSTPATDWQLEATALCSGLVHGLAVASFVALCFRIIHGSLDSSDSVAYDSVSDGHSDVRSDINCNISSDIINNSWSDCSGSGNFSDVTSLETRRVSACKHWPGFVCRERSCYDVRANSRANIESFDDSYSDAVPMLSSTPILARVGASCVS